MSPLPFQLAERRVLFVGGKGGVGKTTTAGAIALARARTADDPVLLVSTDPAHSLSDLFDVPLGDEPSSLAPGLEGMEIDPAREVEAYLDEVRRNLRGFVKPAMFPEIERQIDLARHAPGAVEAALLDRVAELMDDRLRRYAQVIFDTAPTGHTLRLLALPEVMQAWTEGLLKSRDRSERFGRALERLKGGIPNPADAPDEESAAQRGDDLSWFEKPEDAPRDPRGRRVREILLARRRKFSRARRVLLDKKNTAFVLVLIPERLPILESSKALEVLRRHRVPVAGLVVNRVLPADAQGEFLDRRREQERQYLDRIDTEFRDLPRIRLPLLAHDVQGIPGLEIIARHLRAAVS